MTNYFQWNLSSRRAARRNLYITPPARLVWYTSIYNRLWSTETKYHCCAGYAGAALRPERCVQSACVRGVRCHGSGQPAQEPVPLPGMQAHHRHCPSVLAVCLQASLPGTHGHGYRASHAICQVEWPHDCLAPTHADIAVHCLAHCIGCSTWCERHKHRFVDIVRCSCESINFEIVGFIYYIFNVMCGCLRDAVAKVVAQLPACCV